ncbi:DUF3944 domain-containing protein [Edwardsiella ictaluri]|uniref:DUF3944 domain-containing protein n=1 Tax=Edwardsiella ictaluri TaxID=67780 RepID=UPI0039F65265
MATYLHDPDLRFLRHCDGDDLDLLVSVLTHDPKDGLARITETLTHDPKYQKHYPNHPRYWEAIAAEVQTFGANSFVTLLRGGKGVCYREVLTDACDKMKVNYNTKSSIESIEMNMLMKILEKSLTELDSQDLQAISEELGTGYTNPTPEVLMMAIQAGIKTSGFAAYQMALIVTNGVAKALLGRGLSLAGNALLTRTMGIVAGPIGWILSSLWLLIDLAGPAYRVTIPSCIFIAYMRQKHLYAPTPDKE